MLVQRTRGTGTWTYAQDLVAPLSQMLTVTYNGDPTNYLYGHERLQARSPGKSTSWYHTDALGSVRHLSKDDGTLSGITNYDPWGTIQPSASTEIFRFTGEFQDQGLVHLRARWYAPSTGTFTSRDPFAGFAETPYSLHPYGYVGNNPINYSDPTGLFRCQSAAAIQRADMLGLTGMRQGAERGGVATNWAYYAYADFCRGAYRTADTLLQSYTNAVAVLVALFAHADLPGGADRQAMHLRQTDLTAAAERLEFVLDWMEDIAGTTFKHETGQEGFNQQFIDPWPVESGNQMNHFMQAAGLAYDSAYYVNHWAVQGIVRPDAGEDATTTALWLIVGHEKVGDAGASSLPGRKQASTAAIIPAQYRAATPQDIDLFVGAVQADALGDTVLRDCLLQGIIPEIPTNLAEILQSPDYDGSFDHRIGNSVQDLRLSVTGWRFGEKIRNQEITTLADASSWLALNLR